MKKQNIFEKNNNFHKIDNFHIVKIMCKVASENNDNKYWRILAIVSSVSEYVPVAVRHEIRLLHFRFR